MDSNMVDDTATPRLPTLPGLLLAPTNPQPKQEPATLPSKPDLVPDDGEDDWQDVHLTNPASPVAVSLPHNEDDYVYIDSDDDLAQAGHEYPEDDGVEVKEEVDLDESVRQFELSELDTGDTTTLAMRPAAELKPANAAPCQPVTEIASTSPSPAALQSENSAGSVNAHATSVVSMSSARLGRGKRVNKSTQQEEESLFVEAGPGLDDMPDNVFRNGPQYHQRKLDPTVEQPPTVCFEEHSRNALVHVLTCGHRHVTAAPRACNRSCRLSDNAESKTGGHGSFVCEDRQCVQKEKKLSAVFNKSYKGGDIKVRKPVKARANTAYYADRLSRALKIDGSDKLFAMPEEERRKIQFGNAELADPRPKKEPPHSYGGRIREQQLFEYTMPDGMQAEMEDEENNVTLESAADGRARLNINRDGFYEAEDRDEQDVGDDQAEPDDDEVIELHCTCGSPADSHMVQCTDCANYFHPKCVGKGDFSPEEYESERGRHALQADFDRYQDGDVEFLCVSCDNVFKSVLAESILHTKTMRNIKDEGKTAAHQRAADQLQYHTGPAMKRRIALQKANGDPIAIKAANDTYAAAVEAATKLDQELFGGSDDDATKDSKTLRFTSRQQEKNKGVVLEKIVGQKTRIGKPSKTKTKHGSNTAAIMNTVLANNTTPPAAVKALRTKANWDGSNIECDFCDAKIIGLYYACKGCPDIDCCEKCADKGKSHVHQGHTFEAKHARQMLEQKPKASGGQAKATTAALPQSPGAMHAKMVFCIPSLRSRPHFFEKQQTKQPTHTRHYTISRDPSLDLREASQAISIKDSEAQEEEKRSSFSKSIIRAVSDSDVTETGTHHHIREGKKREFSVLSIESLMKKAHAMLLRRSSVASFASVFAEANAASDALEAEHADKDSSDVEAARKLDLDLGTTKSNQSSLRHKRDVSDLRSRYNLSIGAGRRTPKRASQVMSEGGESAWVTDDEGE
ncbi:hypothetical protein LTR86_000839 [Recurvomyces mirabilis]|nr:hypothetical protein LTR86_000839 [Recurvomyces mirabilis]